RGRHGRRHPAGADLGKPRLRRLGRACGAARDPAAAAARALPERVPRVRDRVPLRRGGRAGNGMRRVAWLVLMLFDLAARPAAAGVTGQIYGPGRASFAIAVVPPKNLGGGPDRRPPAAVAAAPARGLRLP